MPTNALLANMACIADFGDPNRRYQRFLQNGRPAFRNLIESILLFDEVVIPTNDFMPLGILLGVLGEEITTRLLEEEIIKFARFSGFVAYIGNGGGISVCYTTKPDTKRKSGPSASSGEVLEWLVSGMPVVREKRTIQNLALRATVEFSLESESDAFVKKVYDQVTKFPDVLSGFGLVELNRLPGIGPDGVRPLGSTIGTDANDDISQILRVARACIEALAAQIADCDDIYTSDQVGELFRKGFKGLLRQANVGASYTTITELAGLPDVGELALQQTSVIASLLKLRSSSSGAQFRSWFHKSCRTEDIKILAKEYSSVLQEIPFIQTTASRAIRFTALVGISALMLPFDPLLGLGASAAAGAIDAFVLDRAFKGASPKIFLEQINDALER